MHGAWRRQLCAPFGSHGLLRVRASAELRVSHSYGPMVGDASTEQLYHMAGCTGHTSVGFGLSFTSSSGFAESWNGYDGGGEALPTLQVAHSRTQASNRTARLRTSDPQPNAPGHTPHGDQQTRRWRTPSLALSLPHSPSHPLTQVAYSCSALVEVLEDDHPDDRSADGRTDDDDDDSCDGGAGGCGGRRRVRARRLVHARLLRVHTVQAGVARAVRALYEGLNDRVAMALLTHKVKLACVHACMHARLPVVYVYGTGTGTGTGTETGTGTGTGPGTGTGARASALFGRWSWRSRRRDSARAGCCCRRGWSPLCYARSGWY